MEIRKRVFAALLLFGLGRVAAAECPVERGPVKGATDADAQQVRFTPIPTSIQSLHAIPTASRPLPQEGRVAPAETSIYSVTATLIAYRLTPAGEIHLVLSDDARRTITAIVPSSACATGSRFLSLIVNARTAFDRRFSSTETWKEVRQPIEVQGIGFFDYFRGQRGLAPNGLSLYPVTFIDLTPAFAPKAPALPARRRGVGSGEHTAGCVRPSFSLSASRGSACAGESVTLNWAASDANARVDIAGIGSSLPASGSRLITATSSAAYSGRAFNSCGSSDEEVAVVSLTATPSAALTGPSTLASGSSGTLAIAVSAPLSWTLRSFLGNPISPSFGATNSTATYTANTSGTDTVTLTATGSACGTITKIITIIVSSAPSPPPPPPPPQGLLCCDNTRSPSCFSCSKKSGCCSGHGGVCGCL